MRLHYEGNRYLFWPIQVKWGKTSSSPFTWHGWQKGFEPGKTGAGCMPGKHRVMGQVLHFWKLKLCFGELKCK